MICIGMSHSATFLTLIFLSACKEFPPASDPESTVEGLIIDAHTLSRLDGVFVGYKNPSLPDSVIFSQDPLPVSLAVGFLAIQISRNGSFQFDFAFSPTSLPLELMFVFKKGYHLRRFDQIRDTVHGLAGNTDFFCISLIGMGKVLLDVTMSLDGRVA